MYKILFLSLFGFEKVKIKRFYKGNKKCVIIVVLCKRSFLHNIL